MEYVVMHIIPRANSHNLIMPGNSFELPQVLQARRSFKSHTYLLKDTIFIGISYIL
jgi:hypothetical protein